MAGPLPGPRGHGCLFPLLRERRLRDRRLRDPLPRLTGGTPAKKRGKALVSCFMEAKHLTRLLLSEAGFGPTAQMHQPDRIRVGL